MGKITVKHYLNTKLKPSVFPEGVAYPVYVRVTRGRKNERFHSIWVSRELTENEFMSLQWQNIFNYETKLIEYLLKNIAENEDFNIGNGLEKTTDYISDILFSYKISTKKIKRQIIDYVCERSGLSKEIFDNYVRVENLNFVYWQEIIDKKILNNEDTEIIKYFITLLEFESIYYIDDSTESYEPGKILNSYEWEINKGKENFLHFISNKNVINPESIKSITDSISEALLFRFSDMVVV